ncbi:hypothetical protein AB0B45_44055 [Nonomuraea sp. NPDC049152]|uniref:hypothetical protein n=1 Tax=Nonomuraea sp. NPDC049152 TaxID=3154350 RepID=UPI0034013D3A
MDEHQTTIAASRDLVWAALRRYVDSSLLVSGRNPLAWLLGTVPRTGFEVSREVPRQQLSMAGRHRFARYLLVFELADVAGGKTVLSARTYAHFPGPHGLVYRALVIGSRAHVVAVQRMLRSVRRSSLG